MKHFLSIVQLPALFQFTELNPPHNIFFFVLINANRGPLLSHKEWNTDSYAPSRVALYSNLRIFLVPKCLLDISHQELYAISFIYKNWFSHKLHFYILKLKFFLLLHDFTLYFFFKDSAIFNNFRNFQQLSYLFIQALNILLLNLDSLLEIVNFLGLLHYSLIDRVHILM